MPEQEHKMMDGVILRLVRMKAFHLILWAVFLSLVLTHFLTIVLSIFWWGNISLDLVQIGTIIAFVVSGIVASLVIYLSRETTRVYFENEVLRDEIERRRRTEESLLLLQNAVDTISVGVTIADLDGKIMYTNRAEAEMHGFALEEMRGKDVRTLAPEQLWKGRPSKRLSSMENWKRESFNKRKDGSVFPVQLTSVPVKDTGGQPRGIITVSEDISERKKTEAEREALLKQKDMFITRLGHDLRTPLTPLMALLPLVKKQEADPKLRELLDVGIQSVKIISELVTKTLKHARLSSPGMMFQMKRLDLAKELEHCMRKHHYLIETSGQRIENRVKPEMHIEADKTELQELFCNLMSNAIKYSKGAGVITVDAAADNGVTTVRVQDTGVGLSDQQLEDIFDEFYKEDESRHELDSSGLGLSICRKIVEKQGGRIWAESQGKGQGTTFCFTLKSAGFHIESTVEEEERDTGPS